MVTEMKKIHYTRRDLDRAMQAWNQCEIEDLDIRHVRVIANRACWKPIRNGAIAELKRRGESPQYRATRRSPG